MTKLSKEESFKKFMNFDCNQFNDWEEDSFHAFITATVNSYCMANDLDRYEVLDRVRKIFKAGEELSRFFKDFQGVLREAMDKDLKEEQHG